MNAQVPRQISAKDLAKWLQSESQRPFIIDVRENQEIEIAPFLLTSLHLPLSQMSIWGQDLSHKLPLEQPLVVICHSGIRSMNFGFWLLDQGLLNEVWNLDGGIDSWSVQVDSSVPRY